MDQEPEWSAASLKPWGHRTGDRPELINPTATDAGPGEYTADHQFGAGLSSCPSPIFRHPLQSRKPDEVPDPTAYAIPSTVGTGPSYSVGPGQRGNLGIRTDASPGP